MKESNAMVSVVIAAYNEEKVIGATLKELTAEKSCEVIVVDGQSTDKTAEIASEFPVRLLSAEKNRAHQYNVGAQESKGDILVFLHADCMLESGSLQEIEELIKAGYDGGCFKQKILNDRKMFRLIEKSGNFRAKMLKIFFGDQAIFVKRDMFFSIGGYDKVDLLDDVLFSRKLRKRGKTAVLNKKVYTYSRRWEKLGIVKTTLINWTVSLGFMLGVPPDILKKIYKDIR